MTRLPRAAIAALVASLPVFSSAALAQTAATAAIPGSLSVAVDMTEAPRKIFRVHETIPVQSGPLSLYYPKWIPGEHSPSGPIMSVAGLHIRAGQRPLPWRRDLLDMYTLHLDIPQGVTTIELDFEFLSTGREGDFGQSVSATPELFVLAPNQVVFYPAGHAARDISVASSLRLPRGWSYATAMTPRTRSGDTVSFATLSLESFIDSPVIAGEHLRTIDLGALGGKPMRLNVVADTAQALQVQPAQTAQFRNLVGELQALFASQHFDHYDFLLTLSDHIGHFGLEHHQSSDNRLGLDYFTDADHYRAWAGLLPHEVVHSWNGKFRRPIGLATSDYHQPMQGDLLWVYEGLTTYYGDVLTARAGLWTADDYRQSIAGDAAEMSQRPGRRWRPLQDTADAAQLLYYSSGDWANQLRGTDFYPEGALLWLEADMRIREASRGKRSLDDFMRRFYAVQDGQPGPLPYSFDDVVAGLEATQATGDWSAWLRERLDAAGGRSPLAGLERAGWKVEYREQPTSLLAASEDEQDTANLMYSIGAQLEKDGKVRDVMWGGPAFAAGLAPLMTIVAVNDVAYSRDAMQQAISDAKLAKPPIRLLVRNVDAFRTIEVDYHGGLRYPHLARIDRRKDVLTEILRAQR
jgi:predicted metalloprotease with PDZ domain